MLHLSGNNLTHDKIEDMLSKVSPKNIEELLRYLPSMTRHKSWDIRCDALDAIGLYGLKQFRKNVLDLLKKDRNINVKCYALRTLYDLSGSKRLPCLRDYLFEKNVKLRLTALAIHYLLSRRVESLDEITKIVTRKNCDYHHQYLILNIFKDHIDINKEQPIKELFERVLSVTNPDSGIHRDIKAFVK